MKLPKWIHVALALWMSVYLVAPRVIAADGATAAGAIDTGQHAPAPSVQIKRTIGDVVLHDGQLRGALVDDAGRGVEDAPVVIGQDGKPLKELRTDKQGRFRYTVPKPGLYQVVSHSTAAGYRLWTAETAPEGAKQGIVHQVDPQVARGAHPGGLWAWLTNPVFLALLIAAAIAIPLALDDDDDPAS
ncbi:carboxypeptidase-like regulatory domain-containing protein [Roseimaritima sediminicola]|uniref:carboxypeptidase-like regulatory domain-containing protein n=1 Tax=Roseimaritima sediminicola TaxID=2662066 RepID=UPI0012983C93|nr:carboxypeptidase-like regulatory domain-containing protein [Roseimaritima sediminicola]